MLAHAAPVPLPPRVAPLSAAVGLTLAIALRTLGPLPAFDTSAMDGFAVAGPGPWLIRGKVCAGVVWEPPLQAGDCVQISTGALVPAGATSVLPVELADLHGSTVCGSTGPPDSHIRRTGEDATPGTVLAPAGSRVSPAMLGLAASCGYDTLVVRPRPRVRILVTGDELRHSGTSGAGQVRDALGPMLPALVTELGGEATDVHHVPDVPLGALAEALTAFMGQADVLLVSGSTSVGATDQLRPALTAAGATWVVDTVACRPGHPQLLARLGDGRWVVGLPGNPFAAFVAAHTLLGPLLTGLSGRRLPVLPEVPVTGPAPSMSDVTRLVPVAWESDTARVVGGHRAAFLQGAALGDGFVALPPGWRQGESAALVQIR